MLYQFCIVTASCAIGRIKLYLCWSILFSLVPWLVQHAVEKTGKLTLFNLCCRTKFEGVRFVSSEVKMDILTEEIGLIHTLQIAAMGQQNGCIATPNLSSSTLQINRCWCYWFMSYNSFVPGSFLSCLAWPPSKLISLSRADQYCPHMPGVSSPTGNAGLEDCTRRERWWEEDHAHRLQCRLAVVKSLAWGGVPVGWGLSPRRMRLVKSVEKREEERPWYPTHSHQLRGTLPSSIHSPKNASEAASRL